jgi:hypothetical protein
MKTIEFDIKHFKKKKQMIQMVKALYKRGLENDPKFHFLFEPNLIIRTSIPEKIIKILNKENWVYKVYDYPYPKKGFGESKKWKNIQKYMEELLHLQSTAVLNFNKTETKWFANRLHHTFLNMLFMEYYDEAKYHLEQAKNYMYIDYKEERKPAFWLLYQLIRLVYKIT